VADRYVVIGRTSIDPVVFFRLQLVMFFEDIRSERRLMEIAADRLSIRWYLGTVCTSHCRTTSALPGSRVLNPRNL
jgi:hypothetical protein